MVDSILRKASVLLLNYRFLGVCFAWAIRGGVVCESGAFAPKITVPSMGHET